jgi:hypothetical protein
VGQERKKKDQDSSKKPSSISPAGAALFLIFLEKKNIYLYIIMAFRKLRVIIDRHFSIFGEAYSTAQGFSLKNFFKKKKN